MGVSADCQVNSIGEFYDTSIIPCQQRFIPQVRIEDIFDQISHHLTPTTVAKYNLAGVFLWQWADRTLQLRCFFSHVLFHWIPVVGSDNDNRPHRHLHQRPWLLPGDYQECKWSQRPDIGQVF